MECEQNSSCPIEDSIQSITESTLHHAERLAVVEQQIKGISETLLRLVDSLEGWKGYSAQIARHDEALLAIRSDLESVRNHHLKATEQADRRWTLAARSILGIAIAVALSLLGFVISSKTP